MKNLCGDKSLVIIGCGGLGCYVVESLLRCGAGKITVCDGDSFTESNLNRQLYATPRTLGQAKVRVAEARAIELGYKGEFKAYEEFFSKDNAEKLLCSAGIVIDALDNVESRLILEDECAKRGLPIIHGAVGGWLYQVAVSMPGSGILHKIYEDANAAPAENYSFTVQLCAARQAAEAIKLASGMASNLENSLLICDLKSGEEQVIELN